MNENKIKIGFIINYRLAGWLGVTNYYKNLFYSIQQKNDKNFEIVILSDKYFSKEETKFFKNVKIIRSNLFDRRSRLLKIINFLLILFFGKNIYVDKFLINQKISVISHTSSLGRNSKIPSIKWFPDFQEFKFPKNFSFRQRFARKLDIYFSSINSTKILLSSYSVQKQLKLINKEAFKKSNVLRHATFLRNFKIINQNKLKKKFNIERNYFFLPNHFWKHKNHIVVYKAIKLAKKKNKKILLVTTGNTYDYRFPDHYDYLQNFINKEHLHENILHLGIVDQNELFSLIKYSIALINPSLFEGWGNSLEHSILFNKIAILSNIDVHKERKNKNKILFNSNDHIKLSKIMLKILEKKKRPKKKERVDNENLEFNNFGKNYLNFIKGIANQF